MNNVTLGMQGFAWLAWGVALVGVAVLAWGVLIGVVELVRLEIHRLHGREIAHERALVRQDLGYYILLGLEFLIAADIIRTILHPGLEELGVLGAIVAIRTVISHFLTREMQQAGRLEKLNASGAESDTTD
ncbi:MAG: DUF1622 domain-containing protein [Armatimonadota bacterium]